MAAYTNWLESRHPEWNVVPAGGEEGARTEFPLASWADPEDPEKRVQKVPGAKWRFPCINSPRGRQIVDATREIVERYHPDAYCLDMLHVTSALCVCNYCRPDLEKICGTKQLTAAAIRKNWRQYVDWKLERSASIVNAISAVLKHNHVLSMHNAGVPLPVAAAGGAGEQWMPNIDICLLEGFFNLDLTTLVMRAAAATGKPIWQLLTANWPNYGHLSAPKAWWRATAATCKANGAAMLGPCGNVTFPDTTTSKEVLDNVTDAFHEFMRDADLHPSISQAKIGLVFAWANRRYFRSGAQDGQQELLGWSRVLLQEHRPYDVIIAEHCGSAADLAKYDLIILPNVAHLSDGFCAAIREYVRGGGRLLAVGNPHSAMKKDFSGETSRWGSFLVFPTKASTPATLPSRPRPNRGRRRPPCSASSRAAKCCRV